MITKLLLQICLHLYGTRGRVALVICTELQQLIKLPIVCHIFSLVLITFNVDKIYVNIINWQSKTSTLTDCLHSVDHLCGGTFYNPSGSLNSPNYPGNYGNNLDCSYYIVGGAPATISFNFTSFNTELCCDFVEVRKYVAFLI